MAYVQLNRFDGTNWISYDLKNAQNAVYSQNAEHAVNAVNATETKNTESMKPVDISPTIVKVVNPYGRTGFGVIGSHSIGFGRDCEAAADSGIAIGVGSQTLGKDGISVGRSAHATKDGAISIGFGSSASETRSIAIGYQNMAGISGVAIGDLVTAAAECVSIGEQSKADNYSVSIGAFSKSLGETNIALGYGSTTSANEIRVAQIGTQSGFAAVYGGAAYSVRSDERDKTDIQPINHCLDFINKIEPIQFVRNNREKYLLEDEKNKELYNKYGMCDYDKTEWKNGTKKGTRKNVGVKAQQVLDTIREIYHDDNYANIVNDSLYDVKAKGENPTVENKLTVAYSNFIPFLIGAIQEQQKQIDELKATVTILQSKVV